MTLTNEQLCRLVEGIAIDRDRGSFAELYRHFAPRLKGFGLRLGVQPAAAEELVQETMLTVWRKAATFDARKATVSTWMYTIVRNKRIDMFRREGYPDADLDEIDEVAGDDAAADDQVFATESAATIREAMKNLPKEQLAILEMAFFDEKSHSRIAVELNLPLGTVKSRIRLALARLRATLPEGTEV